MFSQVSVCHSVQGGACDHYLWCIRPLCTALPPMALALVPPLDMDLTVQEPPVSDIWWPSLETCSNLFTLGPNVHWCWYLVAVDTCMFGASGQYDASYWNAFLLNLRSPHVVYRSSLNVCVLFQSGFGNILLSSFSTVNVWIGFESQSGFCVIVFLKLFDIGHNLLVDDIKTTLSSFDRFRSPQEAFLFLKHNVMLFL